ncbi:MAG: monovalent cation/H+ antiporter subunit A [Polaromonas sp.]|uniref:monovalent cation/H+ antiporter subunit A n=1 Tax=Polaromonas sp. TaxID=1869339 RepID=UPI00273345EF|nr:monovalent cation/H+ antiporter subunit A [Polaromonas sp.]MDP2818373.1 monovalent cation/H+ antiporter subunit A [Polaromonas sp.]
MTGSDLLPWLAVLPWLAALVLAGVRNNRPGLAAWLAGLAALAGCAGLAMLAPAVFAGEVIRWSVEWLPALGLRLGFRMDGLAWMFALLVLGIGSLVVLYAAYYLDRKDPPARFFMFFMLFMGAMLGVVLADNLILLVVFWELTSLSSFLLIGFWHADPHKGKDAREGARMALSVTGAGGLCLLAGALLIGQIVGSTDLDRVLASGDIIRQHALYEVALVLVLLGCFTKSAQFPFHFWLPHAMAAPTPVSAYLHSATMVKAGVFLLARLYPALGSSEPWFWIVSLTGLTTLLFGAYMALFKHDLKSLLAYSTISHLGLITLLFGLDEPLAVVAGVFHILNHATFKASLFMAAGIIEHETGSRDMRQLSGLWKYMPITGALAMVAAAAMAGVPLLNGFLSKEMFFAETITKQSYLALEWLLPTGATLAAALSVAYSLRFIHDVFFNGKPSGLPRVPHEPPRFMRVPVEFLVLLCLVVGLMPAWVIGPLLAVAAKAALLGPNVGGLPDYTLALWHGFNLPLLMSALALALGTAIYFGLQRRVNLHRLDKVPAVPNTGGRELFTTALGRVTGQATRLSATLQTGSLQNYLLLLVLMATLAGALPFLQGASQAGPTQSSPPASFAFVAIWAIGMAASAACVIFHRQRLLALLLLGAVGLVVSLAFVHFSAPDLALTQLLVEVVTIMLMMLALHWLPEVSQDTANDSRLRRSRDAVIALTAGAGIAALAWMVLGRPFDSISPFFLQTTLAQGGGANAVNVIIVDYRGFDTLGEITVMGIAALVIHALLADWQPTHRQTMPANPSDSHPLMLALISRLLLPLTAIVAVYLFLRGHNLPGGGFIAGLVLAIGLLLQFVANGQAFVGQRMSTDFQPWVGWGLLIAGASGMGSWFFDAPFLTSTYDYPVWPLVGEVPLASAALFDLGVFLTVVGATMVALLSVARLTAPAQPAGPVALSGSDEKRSLP